MPEPNLSAIEASARDGRFEHCSEEKRKSASVNIGDDGK